MPLNVPLKLDLKEGIKVGAIVGDFHYPFHDPATVKVMEAVLKDKQPDFLIYNGDLCDFYQVSVFAKDPARQADLQKDLNMVKAMFARHNKLLPNTTKIMIGGTHEHRFEKFMWSKAMELSSLSCLTIPELYELSKHNITYIPFEQGLLINRIFLVLHGDIASIHSGYTAKRMYEKHGGCGLCNHTHRGGSFYKRDRFGTWGWFENFCLCSLDPDWIKNPNWQQGFSFVYFTDHARFWVEPVPVVDNNLLYHGKVY